MTLHVAIASCQRLKLDLLCYINLFLLELLRLDGNEMNSRVPESVCDLRDGSLEEFIVDCPFRIGSDVIGVVCGVPTCCTECRVPTA